MQGEALFREHGRQAAALCWRMTRGSTLEVLLITSLSRKRWILPKGWLEPDTAPQDNAAREAFEEAGVIGKASSQPAGSYHYLKDRKGGGGVPCVVDVFPIEVTGQMEKWPEKDLRQYAWLPVEQAAAVVSEPGLRQILKDFAKQTMPAKARRAAG
jgi:8-oxo-dGTP pyrophosphatase MutT (NUDIX family)